MAAAIFLSNQVADIDQNDPSKCRVEFNFVICGDAATSGQVISAGYLLGDLDTPIQIKRNISIAMRDAAGLHGVTLLANDILVPDMSRGLLV